MTYAPSFILGTLSLEKIPQIHTINNYSLLSCPTNSALEILDLILLFKVTSKQILVGAFSKPTNSFTYIMLAACLPQRNNKKAKEGVDLRLRQIRDTDSQFKIRSNKYQQYLIARGYKPHKVSKQFFDVE